MEWMFFLIGAIGSFSLGYAMGKVRGYANAQPKRDARGRYIKG